MKNRKTNVRGISDFYSILIFFGSLLFSLKFILPTYLIFITPIVNLLTKIEMQSTAGYIIVFSVIVLITLGVGFIVIPFFLSVLIQKLVFNIPFKTAT